MPLIVYASLDLLKADAEARAKETISVDLSNILSTDLAEQVETVRTHQKDPVSIYLGYLDPVYMISPYHETILRRSIQSCKLILTTSDPTALSLCWKNGIDYLHIVL